MFFHYHFFQKYHLNKYIPKNLTLYNGDDLQVMIRESVENRK
ncbi:hypothetical protein CHCC20335_3754 [Bacillus paralicheniformis]|nr:hypothetical protein CHCC20335_3754 [Bacillus paralicheniformis]